ncbi:MAG: aspartate aminotransferase family protein [Bacteroidia bacterium]|nr:aspartate aminotransferase family protein [Bacteroidia bacterium]
MNEELFYRHVAQTSPESIGIEVQYAKGIFLYGPNEKKWIDITSGICVSNVGHGAPEILQAIEEQSKAYLHPMVYGEVIMEPQSRYAGMLAEELGEGLDCVYFGNSGAEVIEGALKLAKKYTSRSQIISFHNAYHGSTHGAMSVTGAEKKKKGYGPLLPEVSFIHFNEEEEFKKINEQTACVIVEAIQGAGGIILPKAGYFQALKARCEQVGALLILDEIQTGLGRTGKMFAHQLFDFKPDILVLAKALGGGLPLGAFISSKKIMSVFQHNPVLGHLTTYGGHPLSCAAGIALFEKIRQDKLLDRIPALEKIIKEKLQHPAIQMLRGSGLMYAVIFKDFEESEAIRKEALKQGLLSIGFLNIDNGLRICPPLTISEEELREACDILLQAIDTVVKN